MKGIGRIVRGPGDGLRGDCDSVRDMGAIGLNRLVLGKIIFRFDYYTWMELQIRMVLQWIVRIRIHFRKK